MFVKVYLLFLCFWPADGSILQQKICSYRLMNVSLNYYVNYLASVFFSFAGWLSLKTVLLDSSYVCVSQINTVCENLKHHLKVISLDAGISSFSITADISKPDDVQRMVDAVVSRWGAIHIACNNAGVNMNSASEETTLDEWDKTFDVNLRGTFMCCQVCVCVCKIHTVISQTYWWDSQYHTSSFFFKWYLRFFFMLGKTCRFNENNFNHRFLKNTGCLEVEVQSHHSGKNIQL